MKEKILEALKTKYKTLGLGDSAFNGVADILEKTITEESQIETAISGVEDWLKVAQGEGDRVRNDKSGQQAKQTQTAKANGNPTPEPTPNPNPQGGGNNQDDLATIIANAIAAATKPLADKLANIEGDKLTTSRRSVLENILQDAPEAYKNSTLADIDLYSSLDDEKFNARVEQIKATANDLSLAQSSSRPFGGGRSASKEASDAEIAEIVKGL